MEYSRLTDLNTLLGLAVQKYSDVRALPMLMWENGYELPTAGTVGAVVAVPVFSAPVEPTMPSVPSRVQVATYFGGVSEGQSLLDLSIQEYGSVAGLAQIMFDNAFLPSTPLNSGSNVLFQTIVPEALDSPEARYFRGTGRRVNLHLVTAAEGGYWLTEDGQPWETEDGQFWEL